MEHRAVSHESSALLLGLRVLRSPASPVVTCDRNGPRALAGHEVFRARLPDADLLVMGGTVITSPLRTVCDLARHRCFDAAVVTLDSALTSHLILPGDVEVAMTRLARGGRGSAVVRRVLLAGDSRAQSGTVGARVVGAGLAGS